MRARFTLLTAAAIIAMAMPAGAQDTGKAAPKAQTQTNADDGLTPAQRASKKSSRPKAEAPAPQAPAATVEPTTATTQEAPAATAAPSTAAPGQTGAAPGQAQATPGEASQLAPAQTGTTPSGQAVPSSAADQAQAATDDTQGGGALKPATAADVKSGVSVYDSKGTVIGKIESVSGANAVLASGDVRASIPISSFAKNDKGLVIGMTKSEFEAAAKKK